MATITVTTLNDSVAGDGQVSLREAIQAANTDLSVDGSAAGSGADTIVFAAGLAGGTIRLGDDDGNVATAFNAANGTLSIAAAQALTIDGDIDNDGTPDITITADRSGNDTLLAGGITDIFTTAPANLTDNVRIFDASADLTLDGLTLTGGVALGSGSSRIGGAILSGSSVNLSDSVVSGNQADVGGGGIYASESVTAAGSTISGNSVGAIGGGGGVVADTVHLTGTTVSDNEAGFSGGGIYASIAVTLVNSTVSGNSSGDDGGGIYSEGSADLTDSTVSGNGANLGGGGIFADGTATLTNSTVSGNSANFSGGGINADTATLTNTTVSGNSAGTSGGGIIAGTANLTNSIVLGNGETASEEIDADATVATGLNIVGVGGDTDGALINASSVGAVFASVVEIDPDGIADNGDEFDAGLLADNGGPVKTIALKHDAANPAIDASTALAPKTDARGQTRIDWTDVDNVNGSAADLGAFEAVTANDDSVTTAEDVLIIRSAAEGVFANDPGAALTVDVPGPGEAAVLTTLQGGTIALYADGSYVYVPPADFAGSDTVDYTMNGGAFTATLTIEIAPRADQPEIRMADASLVGLVPASGETVETFAAPILVNHGSIVALANGGYAISFQARTGDQITTDNRDIFVRAFAADGTPTGPAFQVDGAEGSSSPPLLAALPGGGFVAVWQPDSDPGVTPMMRFFTETGLPVAPAEPIGDPDTSRLNGLTPLSNGNFAVSYGDVVDGILVQIFEPDGDPVGGPITLAAIGDPRRLGSIAADDDGGFIIAWKLTSSGMESFAAQRYDATGAPVGSEIVVAAPRPDSDSAAPVVKTLSDGGFVVAWTSAVEPTETVRVIHSQVIGPDGLPQGGEFVSDPVATGSIYGILAPKITVLNDGYLLSWDKGAEPFDVHPSAGAVEPDDLAYLGRIFDNDGGQVSDEILIHLFESQVQIGGLSATVRFVGNPVALPDGGFAVPIMTFDEAGETRATGIQLFDAEGNRVGNLADPNTVAGGHSFPALAVLANGDLAAIWTGYDGRDSVDVHSRIMHFTGPGAAVEETAVTIPLAITINERDGSEEVSKITVDGVPAGFDLAGPAGTTASFDAGTGLWTIGGTIHETLSLTLTPPTGFFGDVTLKATVFVHQAGAPDVASAPLVIPISFNDAPAITTSTLSVAENASAVGVVPVSDTDSTALSFAILGGADAALFVIDPATGALSFAAAPDFDAPADANGDNIYEVIVEVADGAGGTDTQALTVSVTDVDGVTIVAKKGQNVVDATQTIPGQPLPTGEEDLIKGGSGKDNLSGLGGNDVITGGKGKDLLSGSDGDDRLSGRLDKNQLSGGAGDDVFLFDRKITGKHAGFSEIADFGVGDDGIELSQSVFKVLGLGILSDAAFREVGEAKSASDRIIYKASGNLLYDKDGKGGADAVVFAKLTTKPDIDASDFLVVG